MQSHDPNNDIAPIRDRRGFARKTAVAMLGAVIGLGSLGVAPASAAPAETCASGATVDAIEASAATGFVNRLNDLRSSQGKGTLATNSRIADPAIGWSQTMSQQNWLHHARDTGADDGVEPSQDYVTLVTSVVANWRRVGENVGVSGMTAWCSQTQLQSSAAQAVELLHNAFVNSAGHYANMIGDFNQVGIGVHIDADELWVTVRFAKGDLPQQASPDETAAAQAYVDSVYQLFLGRDATSADRSRWVPSVLDGRRSSLTGALAVSDEWAGSRIADFYRDILGREPDAEGRRFWVNAVANGKRLEAVAAGFYGSGEYFRRVGGSNRAFVESLYDQILERRPDGAGLELWTRHLQNGRSRQSVAAGFYGSVESRTDRVENLYRIILGRGADPAGRETWVTKLLSYGDVVLAAKLASSQEYFNRAAR